MPQPVGPLLEGALLPQEHLHLHIHHVASSCCHLLWYWADRETHDQSPQWFTLDWLESNTYFFISDYAYLSKNEMYLFITNPMILQLNSTGCIVLMHIQQKANIWILNNQYCFKAHWQNANIRIWTTNIVLMHIQQFAKFKILNN